MPAPNPADSFRTDRASMVPTNRLFINRPAAPTAAVRGKGSPSCSNLMDPPMLRTAAPRVKPGTGIFHWPPTDPVGRAGGNTV
jgi:hypothetical protein